MAGTRHRLHDAAPAHHSRPAAALRDRARATGRYGRWWRDRAVDRRDDALNRRLTALHREHRERPFTVGVVYGAGHMPAVVEHLRGELRYYVKNAEWLVVVNAPG